MTKLGRMLLVLGFASALVLAAAPSGARAQGQKVKVNVAVVYLSSEGKAVDPSLVEMKKSFDKSGVAFSSYQQMSSKAEELTAGKPMEIALPNGSKATLTLTGIDQGTAKVDLAVAGLKTGVALGRENSVYQDAGAYKSGKLMIVLSAAK